jgi:hypothetical protein
VVLSEPDSPAGKALTDVAKKLAKFAPSMVGKRLPLFAGPQATHAPQGGHAGHNH